MRGRRHGRAIRRARPDGAEAYDQRCDKDAARRTQHSHRYITVLSRCRSVNLTGEPMQGTIDEVILRRVTSALLLLALLVLPCLSLCSGWEASASMRMACCVRLDGHGSQAAADSCCALGQQRQHSESAGRLLAAAVPAENVTHNTITFLSAVPALQGSRVDVGERDHVASTSDTHLLLSVFLI